MITTRGIPLNSKLKQVKRLSIVVFFVSFMTLFNCSYGTNNTTSSLVSDLDTKHHGVFEQSFKIGDLKSIINVEGTAHAKTSTKTLEVKKVRKPQQNEQTTKKSKKKKGRSVQQDNIINPNEKICREQICDESCRSSKMASWIYKKTDKVPTSIAKDYADHIVNNIDPKLQYLVCAHMIVESRGDMFASSKRGDLGLVQIFPRSWEKDLIEAGIIEEARDLFDYRKSILAYEFVIKQLLKENNNDMERALYDYFGGGASSARKTLSLMSDLKRYVGVM